MPVWQKGQSGNPKGRPPGARSKRAPKDPPLPELGADLDPVPPPREYRYITDLGREARKFGELALHVLIDICRTGGDRDRLAAANAILDRGYGKPLQMIDAAILTRKLTELSTVELDALQARLLTEVAALPHPASEGGPVLEPRPAGEGAP
jgi:hypothetical protein